MTMSKDSPVWPPAGIRPYYSDASVCIVHGDAREVLPLIRADVQVVSPPYGVQNNNMAERAKHKYNGRPDILDDSLLDALAGAAVRWNWINIQALSDNKRLIWRWVGRNAERIKDVIIWTKSNPPAAMEPGVMDSAFEFIFCLGDADKRKFDGMVWRGGVRNVIETAVHRNPFADTHRAVFPEQIPGFILRHFTVPSDVILDACCGCGTTLRMAKDHGRLSIGIEIDEATAELAARRMAQEVLPL